MDFEKKELRATPENPPNDTCSQQDEMGKGKNGGC
jgi:hypothetical protein